MYSLLGKSNSNADHYSVANRNVGIFALTATLVMTEFNTATLISFSAISYLAGLKALALPLIFFIALIFYALTVSKKWKEFNGITVVDFFAKRYGKNIGIITSIFLLSAMAGFSATYLKSLTFLFENIAPELNYWIISGYISLLTLFMVIRKGLTSIIKLDVFAFLVVLIGLPILLYYNWDLNMFREGVLNKATFTPSIIGNDLIISLLPLTMFSYILAPWYGQRIFAAKNSRVAYISVILSAAFVFIFYAIGVLLCYILALKGVGLNDPQQAFPYILDSALQRFFAPLSYLFLFLISSTTLAGMWNAMANIALELVANNQTKDRMIIMTFFCAGITYLLANLVVDNILNKMILANIPVISLSFALLAGFYWPKVSLLGVYSSLIVGMISGVSTYLYFGEEGVYTYYWAFIGIPAIFASGIIGSLLEPIIKRKIITGLKKADYPQNKVTNPASL
jgi:Na+/proline symporter